MSKRQCGGCTACCKITPVKELDKPANTRCQHQRFQKGCAIYAKRPMSCRLWSCAWLVDPAAADLRRPDHGHMVVDILPDFVTLKYGDGQPDVQIPVVQVWIDPAYPDAHRDPAFRAYIERRGEDGFMALIRTGSMDAWVLCPPNLASDGEWHEQRSNTQMVETEHRLLETMAVLQELGR